CLSVSSRRLPRVDLDPRRALWCTRDQKPQRSLGRALLEAGPRPRPLVPRRDQHVTVDALHRQTRVAQESHDRLDGEAPTVREGEESVLREDSAGGAARLATRG